MAQGNYDHPSYLTRQMVQLGRTTAGATGTSAYFGAVSNFVVRKVALTVQIAGTAATTSTVLSGTTSIGTIAITSAAVAGTVFTSADLNTLVTAGNALSIKNGADATHVVQAVAEAYLDVQATWT
jgi:hypothetical protein